MTTILSFVSSKKVMTTFLLLLSALSFSQTVTNIFPTRVTTSTTVTIIGTGFTDGDEDHIAISNWGIGSKVFISETEMNFKINVTGGDRTADLSITGGAFPYTFDVSTQLNYIAPTSKTVSATDPDEIRVREVYTTWDQNGDGVNFWKSSDWNPSSSATGKATWPNDSHELLGFKMNYGGNDIIFSTGVKDSILETQLDVANLPAGVQYIAQDFKAYSTNGVSGKPNSNNYMGFADKIDGRINSSVLNNAVELTVYDVIIDGTNGLDLGTGIANFNNQADIRFYSGNGNVGALNDDVPDLLITQMAQPGGTDVYYYADLYGNVVGRPIKLEFKNTNDTRLYEWITNFYRLDHSAGATFETSRSTSITLNNGVGSRGFRMAALSLEDFGINGDPASSTDEVSGEITNNFNSIERVNNINMGAGGSSDMSFIAYNKSAFDIKSPEILKSPVSRFVCRFPSSVFAFTALGGIEGGASSDIEEKITYIWFKNNVEVLETEGAYNVPDTYTIPAALVSSTDLEGTTYKVRVKNTYGAVDLPFTITEGGTPTYWDDTNKIWELPTVYTDNNISVPDGDRSLRFTAVSNDLEVIGAIEGVEGCDCVVSAGQNVTIGEEYAMTLYNSLTVEDSILETDIDGNPTGATIPAGIFTLEDDASLVQINDVANRGDIVLKREADNLNQYDYVYWSSPVAGFGIAGIPGSNKYEWNPQIANGNTDDSTVGDWVSANGFMSVGRGYIARVPSSANVTATFNGVPNNGDINIAISKTPNSGSSGMASIDKHWNLIGNPYPSAIDAIEFLTHNSSVVDSGIDGGVYLWTHTRPASSSEDDPFYDNDDTYGLNYGNQYIAYNAMGNSDPSDEFKGKIASGQGFFVQVLDDFTGSPSVSFNNAMRHDNYEAHNNDEFYRGTVDTSVAQEKQLVWLSLANENNHAMSTLIGYAEGATEGKDRLYDAYTNNEGFNLYSLITEDEKLVIQGLPLPFVDTNTVPLGIELTQSGIYNIAIGNVKGSLFVDQEQDIYLEDTYTNVTHDLRASPYTFTGEAGEFNDRFILKYTTSLLSVSDVLASNTFAFVKDDLLNVRSNTGIKAVNVYDLNGREIIAYTSNNQHNVMIEDFQFSKGVYLVSITLEGNIIVTKKIIN
ncbi:T9SS sorting signal type C domain-containing protein [Winogradskyella costae]|uniref:T9SS sorting signal type C domain-containing protein n=1 Tax=Winogradskyella costae TaxID=2697008 RepID=UPI0015C84ACA|nr:T9SS sorting signal type C domain-containing protein [Winogradskyella costae]